MQLFKLSMIFLLILSLFSCSASYKELSKNSKIPTDEFSKYLLNDYKEKADFEAKVMHDWNSAKLYSEKALKAIKGEKIFPQKITYWQIPVNKKKQLIKSYNNLLIIYEDAIFLDPFNLSKAIT